MSAMQQSPRNTLPASRTLVLCFDGTTNHYDSDNTNIVNFFALLRKDDRESQLCYYQAGIGTFYPPGVVSPMFQWIAKLADQALAWYLDQHVMDGYKFICQNYRPGDKICLFGFSRGAYTARAVAGLIYKIGLIAKDNHQQINFAYLLYKRTDEEGIRLAKGFKETFSQEIEIEYVGVWDTVASVGLFMSRSLPFTVSNTAIRTFRHAVSLDERRAKFRPNMYHRNAPSPAAAVLDPNNASPIGKDAAPDPSSTGVRATAIDRSGSGSSSSSASSSGEPKKKTSILSWRSKSTKKKNSNFYSSPEQQMGVDKRSAEDVKEVWFAGCHSDVGGGNVQNTVSSSLAGISLRWMVREIQRSQCGIQFDNQALAKFGCDITTLMVDQQTDGQQLLQVGIDNKLGLGLGNNTVIGGSTEAASPVSATNSNPPLSVPDASTAVDGSSQPRAPAEDQVDPDLLETKLHGEGTTKKKAAKQMSSGMSQDAIDAVQPLHDDLVFSVKKNWLAPLWWVLEIVPTVYSWQTSEGEWKKEFRPHLGRGRVIEESNPHLHISVKQRMENKELKYRPAAVWKEGEQVWVH